MPGKAGRPARPIVLVVDADGLLRQRLAQDLRLRGFATLEAENGLEALLQVKRARPRAVVLDATMPRLGGLDALRRIRAFDPTALVIVATDEPDADLERQAHALGAAAVLGKPIALPRLLGALEEVKGASAPLAGRLLVVDDDPEFRQMLQEFLTQSGYEVRTAADGSAAFQKIFEDPPDAVLIDIEMPALNGLEALAAIRGVAAEVQVIIISGTENLEVSKRSLAHGAFDYLAKPVDFQYLLQSVETAVMMRRLER